MLPLLGLGSRDPVNQLSLGIVLQPHHGGGDGGGKVGQEMQVWQQGVGEVWGGS